MEELRNRVWDFLYRRGEPQDVAVLAHEIDESPGIVEQVVQDAWFDVRDGWVSIARRSR